MGRAPSDACSVVGDNGLGTGGGPGTVGVGGDGAVVAVAVTGEVSLLTSLDITVGDCWSSDSGDGPPESRRNKTVALGAVGSVAGK